MNDPQWSFTTKGMKRISRVAIASAFKANGKDNQQTVGGWKIPSRSGELNFCAGFENNIS